MQADNGGVISTKIFVLVDGERMVRHGLYFSWIRCDYDCYFFAECDYDCDYELDLDRLASYPCYFGGARIYLRWLKVAF